MSASKYINYRESSIRPYFRNEDPMKTAKEGDLIYTLTDRIEWEPDKTEALPFEVGKEYKTRELASFKVVHITENRILIVDPNNINRYGLRMLDGKYYHSATDSQHDLIPETRVVEGGLRMVPV